jgi:glycine/D-amino acid oxidase-like deaminating enzyme
MTADIVVIAAGANSSDPVLGVGPDHLRLLDRPGVLTYATRSNNCTTSSTGESRVLQRIFVDTIAQTHMLCRTDNTIVIGGGQLVVGGSEDKSTPLKDTPNSSSLRNFDLNEDFSLGHAMIENALTAVLPRKLQPPPASAGSGGIELVRVSRANRPVPYDGLPTVGFVAKGLYLAVTHSGITLGPLIGELAAYEVWHNDERSAVNVYGLDHYGFQILDNFRPSQSRTPAI